jgi:glycosyltransferase involved in cell wall biosynthesis
VRILQIVNPAIALPAETVGGTERIVQYLIEELVKQGHEVTFMGHNDSALPAGVKLIKIGTYLDRENTVKTIWRHLLTHKYDVVHNHGRLMYFLPIIWSKTKKVHTFHMGDLDGQGLKKIIKMRPHNMVFTPCGNWITEKYKSWGSQWQTVNNGLPKDKYFRMSKVDADAPLILMSRIGATKGVSEAINIAQLTGKKLVIAGKVGDYPHEIEWFETQIKPRCDGEQIKFIGTVNDEQKQTLLSTALALLIPVHNSEAFNTTMIEANACGCPVISYNRYCFPEFITNGVNGFLGENEADLAQAVGKLSQIDRAKCREVFECKYTAKVMTDNYLKLYSSSI